MLKDLCFEIIQKCPNNCLFCSSCSSIEKENIISFELFKKTIDHFMNIGGIEEISLSGGEPLLHPNLFEMIAYCKSKNIRTVLFTSGIKKRIGISQTELDKLPFYEKKIVTKINEQPFSCITKEEAKYLQMLGLDKIVFDFQAYEVDTYNTLMNTKNCMTHVLESMLYCSMTGLDVDVHFIPLPQNYEQLLDIVELLNIANIRNLSILNFVPQGRGKENKDRLILSKTQMEEFKRIYEKAVEIFDGKIRIGIPLLEQDKHLCTAGFDKLVIKYDGTVLPCPAFKEFDIDQLHQLGITTPNINDSLDKIKCKSGTRCRPLCKAVYHFDNNIS